MNTNKQFDIITPRKTITELMEYIENTFDIELVENDIPFAYSNIIEVMKLNIENPNLTFDDFYIIELKMNSSKNSEMYSLFRKIRTHLPHDTTIFYILHKGLQDWQTNCDLLGLKLCKHMGIDKCEIDTNSDLFKSYLALLDMYEEHKTFVVKN